MLPHDHLEVPVFDRPTFIIAAPRSGSTLLFESLRTIPGLWTIGGESHEIFDGVLGHHVGNPQFESIRATARDVDPRKTEEIIRCFTCHLIDAHSTRYVDLAPDRRPKSIRLLDKLPKNSFRVPFLAGSFPDAKFIFLTRNARDNIGSLIDAWHEGRRSGRFVTYRRLPGTAFENWCFVLPPGWRGVANESVADIAAFQWAKSNETALDDLSRLAPDRWCAVSFAALISQPIAELRRLAGFMGLEFDARHLAMENGLLAVSSSALSRPSPDKWRRNSIELARVLPQVEATAARIENTVATPLSVSKRTDAAPRSGQGHGMSTRFVGVTGLPRAGSTLLCQLLAQHPAIHCEGRSSPLCNTLLGIRRMISDDTFFLSQLDTAFEGTYAHLTSAMRGFLGGWYQDAGAALVVDKNRAWLHAIELLLHLEPEARLIVCLRELGQVYGSIEAQHQRTILVDFIDHLADFDRFGRADMLFAKDKTIGAPLISLHAVTDLPSAVQERLYFIRFEDLMARPAACMSHLHAWLGISAFDVNLQKLEVGVTESDSHYHMKYTHTQAGRISIPARHEIPARIQSQIETAYAWFYQLYYPKAA